MVRHSERSGCHNAAKGTLRAHARRYTHTHTHARPRARTLGDSPRRRSSAARGRASALSVRVDHLGMLGKLQRRHRIACRLERHALPAAPARVARNGVRPEVALARRERHKALRKRVVLAGGTEKARAVVCASLRDKILVLCASERRSGRSATRRVGRGKRWVRGVMAAQTGGLHVLRTSERERNENGR